MAQWSWRILVALALVALIVVVATPIPLVVIPLVLAVILAATLEPLVRALIRRGRSRAEPPRPPSVEASSRHRPSSC